MSTKTTVSPAPLEPGQFGRRLTWIGPPGIAVFTIGMIFLHLLLRFLIGLPKALWEAPLIAALVIGGVPLLVPLMRKLVAREFGSDHLAGISIITSVLLGEYLVGAIVILMLSGGTALEEFASRRASSVLDVLAKRMPQVAHRNYDVGVPPTSFFLDGSRGHLL
jgi:cation transport ATPase